MAKNPFANWQTIGKKVQAMANAPKSPNPWTEIGNKVAAAANVTHPGAVPGMAAPAAPADPAKAVAVPAGAPYQDSIYNNAISGLQGNLKNFGGSLTNAGNTLMQDYGVDGPAFNPDTYDPNTKFTIDPNVDTKNPFSRAALLAKSYQASSRGDTNSMAARGQLYSGADQNAQNTDTLNFQGGQDSLLKDFGAKWGGLYGQWLNAKGTELTGEGTAGSDALARWVASGSQGPAPSPVQVQAAKQFGKPLAEAPYIGLGPETTTAPKVHTIPKPKVGTGGIAVVKPKAPKGGKK